MKRFLGGGEGGMGSCWTKKLAWVCEKLKFSRGIYLDINKMRNSSHFPSPYYTFYQPIRGNLTLLRSSSAKNIVIIILVQAFPTGYLGFLAGKGGIVAKSHVQQSYLQSIITHQADQSVCFRRDGLLVQ